MKGLPGRECGAGPENRAHSDGSDGIAFAGGEQNWINNRPRDDDRPNDIVHGGLEQFGQREEMQPDYQNDCRHNPSGKTQVRQTEYDRENQAPLKKIYQADLPIDFLLRGPFRVAAIERTVGTLQDVYAGDDDGQEEATQKRKRQRGQFLRRIQPQDDPGHPETCKKQVADCDAEGARGIVLRQRRR